MNIIFMKNTNITTKIHIEFGERVHGDVKDHGILDQRVILVTEVAFREPHIIHTDAELTAYGVGCLLPFAAGLRHQITPAAEGLGMGTDYLIGTRNKDGMKDTAPATLLGTRDVPCADLEAGIKPAVGSQSLGIREASRSTDIREPGEGGYLADTGSGAEDPDQLLTRDGTFLRLPVYGMHLLADESQILRSTGSARIVVLVLLPDKAPDLIWERLRTYILVLAWMVRSKVLDDGSHPGILSDTGTTTNGDPEADNDVIDPVAALCCKLFKMIPLGDQDTELLNLGCRDVRFIPYADKVMEGQPLGIQIIGLALGGSGQHGIDDGGLAAPGHQDGHVVRGCRLDHVVKRKGEIGNRVGMIPEDLKDPFFPAQERIPVGIEITAVGKDLVPSSYMDVDCTKSGMAVDADTVGAEGLHFDTCTTLGADNDFNAVIRQRQLSVLAGITGFWHNNYTGSFPDLLSHQYRLTVAAAGCL